MFYPLEMSEPDTNEILNKINELKSSDGSKINQIIMMCLQAFTIMFVMLKPLCKTWMRYKYGKNEHGSHRTSTGSF